MHSVRNVSGSGSRGAVRIGWLGYPSMALVEVDQDWWHARLINWARGTAGGLPNGLGRDSEDRHAGPCNEQDALEVDALLGRLRNEWRCGSLALWTYYRHGWWDDSIDGYDELARYLHRSARSWWLRESNGFHEPGRGRDREARAAADLMRRAVCVLDRLHRN